MIERNLTSNQSEKRAVSIQRAIELKNAIADYLDIVKNIPTGLKRTDHNRSSKAHILAVLGANEDDWQNWQWHMHNRISDGKTLSKILSLSHEAEMQIDLAAQKFRFGISPYYLSLIKYPVDRPLILQSIPDSRELLDEQGDMDPMLEEYSSPAPCITRRYPDRLIINVTNRCAMLCRHCQRRRNLGYKDKPQLISDIRIALEYIRENNEIRDVLITGGDPLTFGDNFIDWILGELETIPHVEIKRIGTRVPVTLPMRITTKLADMLAKHEPLYINTQFNHPLEITGEAALACKRLARAGVSLGNQMVLLKGVNDDPFVVRKLNQELLKIMVKPYYIFHAKTVRGTLHFRTTIEKGIEVVKKLRGFTSGMAVPHYIVNAPGGLGKVAIESLDDKSIGNNEIILKTWEDKEIHIPKTTQ